MSDNSAAADEASSSAINRRVEPRFFNLNSQPVSKKKEDAEEVEENPHWLNPPPPYSLVRDDQESASTAPSAPPLEIVDDESMLDSQSLQPSHLPQNIPQLNNNNRNYGSINQQQSDPTIPTSNNTLKKAKSWIFTSNNEDSRKHDGRTFFRIFASFLFVVILILLILEYFTAPEVVDCYEGVLWEDLPRQFNYTNKGLRIKMVGGVVNAGRITIKKQEDKANTVEMYAKISPPSLVNNPEFGFGFTRLFNGSTTLEIFIPQEETHRFCIFFNAVIYLPNEGTLNFYEGRTPNTLYLINDDITMDINILDLHTSNQPIYFGSSWKGEQLNLRTYYKPIDITKPIYDSFLVQMETTDAPIRIKEVLNSTYAITMETQNGDIITDKKLSSGTVVSTSSNGYLSHHEILADRVEIKTTNRFVELNHGHISEVLNIQTLNAKLALNMETCKNCTVLATTVNSEAILNMPANYEGDFVATVGTSGAIKLKDTSDWTQIRRIGDYEVTGIRYSPDNKDRNGGHIVVRDYDGDILLKFGNKDDV